MAKNSQVVSLDESIPGRSYSIVSHRQLPALVEQLIQTIQPNGVTLKFDFATSCQIFIFVFGRTKLVKRIVQVEPSINSIDFIFRVLGDRKKES